MLQGKARMVVGGSAGRICATWLLTLGLMGSSLSAVPSHVELRPTDQGVALYRNGKPYFIKGAGGQTRLTELAACGGNSIRTWGVDGLQKVLDEAQAAGLTVTAGIWLGHPQHGFDYHRAEAVARQLDQARQAIETYKDHPALLLWGIGNEMEGDGNDPSVWYAVNHIARLAKELDGHHPTVTVIAEVGGSKVANLHRFCPDVDLVGLNTYGGSGSIGRRYREAGGTKPYVVSEFGPPLHFETGHTRWGAPMEMTSTRKADWYRDVYRTGIAAQPGFCLGSYVFLWGNKQETTATWLGLFLEDGARLQAVEAMREAWGGPPPDNRCPRLEKVNVNRDDGLKPGETITAAAQISDPDGDPLRLRWVLQRDTAQYGSGGAAEARQADIPDAVTAEDGQRASIRIPRGGGTYRLFVYAYDGHGNAATANRPLWVDAPRQKLAAPKAALPLLLYGEGQTERPWIPSGYMGNTAAIAMDPACTRDPHDGKQCLEVSYKAGDQWAGVVWQSPANDWGDQPGGLDLSGAESLTFWARGQRGGEVITVGVGLIEQDKPFPDSVRTALKDLALTGAWRQYRIPLAGHDLSCVKSGFYWTVAGQGRPLTFYLDEIRFVPAE